MIRYKIGYNENKTSLLLKIKPILLDEEIVYSISKKKENSKPVEFFTATTDMRDWIGNIRDIRKTDKDIFCSVEGIYRGSKREIKNIKVRFRKNENLKIGERVMVTEHINVAGGYEMLATKIRLLDTDKPDLNFINIGWSDNTQCEYLRVDPYTGEKKECIGNAVR